MKTRIALAALVLFSHACQKKSSDSELSWAHYPVDQSIGAMNARVSALELGFETDFTNIRVCLQGTSRYKGAALALDSKLAYAAWMEASGQGSAQTWSRFEFVNRDLCDTSDAEFGSVVIIGSPEKLAAGQSYHETLEPIRFQCSRASGLCQTDAVVGAGHTGAVGYANDEGNPNIWTYISSQGPAMVQLSPYVNWASLEQDLAAQNTLLARYRSLLAKADPTYAELVAMNSALRASGLVAARDRNFDAQQQVFMSSGRGSLNAAYTPDQGAFHTLLHEVGHQFGMQHADAPGADAVIGGARVTRQASMAYAEAYLYLTADDSAGVRDMNGALSRYLISHKN